MGCATWTLPWIHHPADIKSCSTTYLMSTVHLFEVDDIYMCLPCGFVHLDSDEDTLVFNSCSVCTIETANHPACSSPFFP